jgi:hypothetical protein
MNANVSSTIPPSMQAFWALFALYWLYVMGTALESEWGSFRFLVYWLVAVVSTDAAAWIAQQPTSNSIFLMTLFLAFATLWPGYVIRVFFVFPVQVKWLAYLDAAYLAYYIGTADGLGRLLPIAGVANYLLFFGPTLRDRLRGWGRQASQAGRRNRMRRDRDETALPDVRTCAICGASNADPDVEIRICDCDRCGGVRRDLCLPHARNH